MQIFCIAHLDFLIEIGDICLEPTGRSGSHIQEHFNRSDQLHSSFDGSLERKEPNYYEALALRYPPRLLKNGRQRGLSIDARLFDQTPLVARGETPTDLAASAPAARPHR